jgi:TIR domain
MMLDKPIFISYARTDHAFVEQLARDLTEQGYTIWLDKNTIPPGNIWAVEIKKGLDECSAMIAVQSTASLDSFQCKGEWLHAQDQGKLIVPVSFEADLVIHPLLSHLHCIDFGTYSSSNVKRLIDALEGTHQEADSRFRISTSGVPRNFPDFFNQDSINYTSLIAQANHIRYSGGTGYNFLDNAHQSALIELLRRGGTLEVSLMQPTRANVEHLALWSAWADSASLPRVTQRILGNLKAAVESLQFISVDCQDEGLQPQLHLLPHFGPFPVIEFDPDGDNARLALGIYAFRRSNKKILRPGTIISQRDFPELYEHIHATCVNMWQHGIATDYEAALEMIEAFTL